MGHVARLTLMKNLCSVLVETLTPFGLPSRREGDHIKMNLDEIVNMCLAWIQVADDRFHCGLTTCIRPVADGESDDCWRLFVCFPGVTTHCGCIFHSPVAGFSLLVFEVS